MKIDKNYHEHRLRYNKLLRKLIAAVKAHPRKSWSLEEVEETLKKLTENELGSRLASKKQRPMPSQE